MTTSSLSNQLKAVVSIVMIVTMSGCYHFRVTAPEPNPATEPEHRMVSSFFWGLVQENIPAEDCASNALDEVRVSTNFGYLLISVATLGIWVPMDVEWRCAKLPQLPDDGL